jgi:hypothetical protein
MSGFMFITEASISALAHSDSRPVAIALLPISHLRHLQEIPHDALEAPIF